MAEENPTTLPLKTGVEQRPQDWWFVELWYENRGLLKEIVKHVIIFVVFAAILEIFHRSHNLMKLPAEELVWLNHIHFYGYIILLVILVVSLIIKVLIIEFRGIKRD